MKNKVTLFIQYVLLHCILLLNFQSVSSQTPGLNFRYLSTRDGLSHDDIRCIYQDRDGFIWIGSEGGIDRYDGRSFQNYYEFIRDSAENTLQVTRAILEDSYENMWFVNDTNGLVVFNKKNETFTRFRRNPENPGSLTNNRVSCLIEDSGKNIWITTFGGGLNLFNWADSSFTSFLHDSTNANSPGSNYLTSIAEDHQGMIWLTSPEGWLIRFNPADKTFENIRVQMDFFYRLSSINTPVLYIDHDNQVWYAIGQNISRYNQTEKTFRSFSLAPEGSRYFFSNVTGMLEVEKSLFLVSTSNNGLYELNTNTGKISHHVHNPANPFSINSQRLSQIYRSREGVIWIGSLDNGINLYSKTKLRFPQLVNLVGSQYLEFSNPATYSLLETPDGNILIGTENNGLFTYDPQLGSLERTQPALKNYSIFSMQKDNNNLAWLCSWVNGLYEYDLNSHKIKQVDYLEDNEAFITGRNIVRILRDSKNRIWIGRLNGGVSRFDVNTGGSVEYRHSQGDSGSLSNNMVYTLFEDSFGLIWVGTSNGLNVFEPKHNSFRRIRLNDEFGKRIENALITDIYEDQRKQLWIGSNRTLHSYNRKTGAFQCVPLKREGNYLTVFKILEDDKHFLWLGTNSGILRFDTKTRSYRDYGLSDGLQYIANFPGSGIKSRDGFMYFGHARGITIFHPDNVEDDTLGPPVFLTSIKVNDVPLSPVSSDPLISQSILYTDFIQLNYKQSTLSFTFASLNYEDPGLNQYAFQLVGHDKDWVRSGSTNTAYYTNLKPGKYVFKVIASNSHGFWNNVGKEITIVIKPPLWRTWGFRVGAGLLTLCLILLLYYNRFNNLEQQKLSLEKLINERTKALHDTNEILTSQHEKLLQQNEEISSQNEMLSGMSEEILRQNAELEQHRSHLEKMVEKRTYELEIALRKAEESDKLKSAFLANMSHEIRTPMNAIVGFANLLKDQELDPSEKDEFIEIINANVEILLVLINDILDLSLIEANQLIIRSEVINLNEILDHLYSSFSMMNRKKDLQIRLNNELHHLNLKVDSDSTRIRQILSNLMNNAYKFTDAGYIELGLKRKEEQLILYVRDTGIGIHESDLQKIFERFRKSDAKSNTFSRGTGLGLAISKALAHLLGGHLNVESSLGHGSAFFFSLPYERVTSGEPAVKEATAHKDLKKWTGKNVLVVEDEQANYLYVKKMLNKLEVNVHWAENGLEAVKMASSGIHFHLILMDIKMPVMDGNEATKIIKSNNPNQIVVALTAYARPEDRENFMKAGFTDYLSKPIKPNDFIGVIRRYIDR